MDAVLMSKVSSASKNVDDLNSAISAARDTLAGLPLNSVKRVQSGSSYTKRANGALYDTTQTVTLPYAVIPEKCMVIVQSAASMYFSSNDDNHMMGDVAWYTLSESAITFYTADMYSYQSISRDKTIYWSIIEFS
jgi:hypothetical protein